MTKLGPMERNGFIKIFQSDFEAIETKMHEQIGHIWEAARNQLMRVKGHDTLLLEKEKLLKNIDELRERVHAIEQEIKSEPLTKQQVVEYGGTVDAYGHARGAKFFGIKIDSQFEYEVVKMIEANLDVHAPAKYLHDVGRSCMRELTMVGTFDQARAVYDKFYNLDFRKYGVDIPPRLHEIKEENPVMLTPPQEQVLLEVKDDIKKAHLAQALQTTNEEKLIE